MMRVRKRRDARTFCGLTFPGFGAYRSGDEYLEKKERTRDVTYIRWLIRAGLNAWRSHAAKWMTSADDVAASRRFVAPFYGERNFDSDSMTAKDGSLTILASDSRTLRVCPAIES